MQDLKFFKLDIVDRIAILTIAYPPLNLLSIDLMNELRMVLETLNADPEVRCIILTGEGKAFCAGFELGTSKLPRGMNGPLSHLAFATLDMGPLPVIAAINGYALGGDWDVIFSNACLQWVPDHGRILGELMSMLREGGELAVQMPVNHNEPIERVIAQTAESDRWRAHFSSDGVYHTLTAGEYYDILSAAASCVDIWQTTYYHVMPSHDAIMDWYRSTGLRPYLNVLSDEDKVQFEADVLAGLRREYPLQADGCVLFPFPRLFFIARK